MSSLRLLSRVPACVGREAMAKQKQHLWNLWFAPWATYPALSLALGLFVWAQAPHSLYLQALSSVCTSRKHPTAACLESDPQRWTWFDHGGKTGSAVLLALVRLRSPSLQPAELKPVNPWKNVCQFCQLPMKANFQWKPRCWTAGYPVQASSSKPRQLPGSEGLERGKLWLWPWRALALAQKRLRAPRLRVLQNVAALLLKFCWEELHCKAWPKCCDGINVITRCTSGYDRVLPLGLKRILFERLYQLSPSGKMRLQPNSKAQIYITWLDKI